DRAVPTAARPARTARLYPAACLHPALVRGAQLPATAELFAVSAARLPGAAALPRPCRIRRAVVPAAAIRHTAIRHTAVRDADSWLWDAAACRVRPADWLSRARLLGLRAAGPEDELDGDRLDHRFVHRRALWHRF